MGHFFISLLGVLACGATGSVSCGRVHTASDELVVLVEASIEGLDPRYAVSGYGVKISRLVASPLVSVDTEDLSVKMELAQRVDNPDPLTYVVTLRRNARFSDGTPVTARDVKATIESMLDDRSTSPYRFVWKRIAKMEILGLRRLRIRLEYPHSPFLTDLDMGILPARLVRHVGPIRDMDLVGAGPFRVVARSSHTIVLAPNLYSFVGVPKIRRVVIRTVQDDNSRLIMLAGGSADLSQNTVPAMLVPAIAGRRGLRVERCRSVTHTYLGLNLHNRYLKDVRVRRAIALAIDRKSLVTSKLHEMATLSWSILPAFHWACNRRLHSIAYDPRRAEQLLDEAGFAHSASGGPRFSLVYKTSNNPFRVSVARAIAGMLAKVGIAVEVRPYEWGVFYSDVKKGNFDIFSMQMTELTVPDYHYHFFHSASHVGASLAKVTKREVDWLGSQLALCLGGGRKKRKEAGQNKSAIWNADPSRLALSLLGCVPPGTRPRRFVPDGRLDAPHWQPYFEQPPKSMTRVAWGGMKRPGVCELGRSWLPTAIRHFVFLVAWRLPELWLQSLSGGARAVAGANRFGYSNPEVDWLLDAARFVSDRTLQKAFYGRVQAILLKDLPIVPLWHEDNIVIRRCNVHGYELLPNARLSGLARVWKSDRHCR
ncbi:MAG: ABC transporter substrate-binding protein [Deltaproteobacteria bacterium]|nr:ABC transporter substrate-binding protein [Deltaproteobacteria bacterium]